MLVLSRKIGEKIVIDGNTTVTIKAISGNRVKLTIEAPKGVRIIRAELIDSDNGGTEDETVPAA
jgi:carbon storage regulator